MAFVYIVPIATGERFWLKPLEEGILHTFGLRSRCLQGDIALDRTFDPLRRQYNSSQILLQLINAPPADALKILGVVEVDLFIPILTFVFGEAQLGGIGALVSLHRLNNKFYGLPEDRRLLTQRLVKESLHELGHTFGLIHCTYPQCVLNASTYVEDIDQKSPELCPRCREQVKVMQGSRDGTGTRGSGSTVRR